MGLDTVLFIIFVIVVFFGGIVKRLLDSLAGQPEARERRRVDYEATQEQIRQFLEGLQPPQEARVADEETPAVARLLDAEAEPELRGPVVRPSSAGRPVLRRSPREGRQTPSPAREPRVSPRRRAPRGRAEAPSAPQAGKGEQPGLPPQALKAAAVTPLAFRGMDLKRAVLWSEILGPPVSARRGRRRPSRWTP